MNTQPQHDIPLAEKAKLAKGYYDYDPQAQGWFATLPTKERVPCVDRGTALQLAYETYLSIGEYKAPSAIPEVPEYVSPPEVEGTPAEIPKTRHLPWWWLVAAFALTTVACVFYLAGKYAS